MAFIPDHKKGSCMRSASSCAVLGGRRQFRRTKIQVVDGVDDVGGFGRRVKHSGKGDVNQRHLPGSTKLEGRRLVNAETAGSVVGVGMDTGRAGQHHIKSSRYYHIGR